MRPMEPFEQEIARAVNEDSTAGPARILVVGEAMIGAPDLVARLEERHHRCTLAGDMATARAAVARHRYDVILLEPRLPDGDGWELAATAHRMNASTKTVVVASEMTPDDVVKALRCGAVDFVAAPTDADALMQRLDVAILKARAELQREERIIRLQRICTELNSARRKISGQVDNLCEELIAAARDSNERIDAVTTATEFRTMLRQELDIEELLRTTLEYFLVKTGPTNGAVFLPDHEDNWALGAYVNYDCPREAIGFLLDQLSTIICPQMTAEDDIVVFDDAREFTDWVGLESSIIDDTQVVAFSCRHDGECLAVFVLFRNRTDPFQAALAPTIDLLRTIFAEQLATVISVHHRAAPQWPADGYEEEDGAEDVFGDDLDDFDLAA